MPVSFHPLKPGFAAKIEGIDLHDSLEDSQVAAVSAMLAVYPVCVVHHETPLSDDEHITFSQRLGPIEAASILTVSAQGRNRRPRSEIIDQGNLDQDGVILPEGDRRLAFKRANRLWHTDMSFHPNRATYSLLSAHVLPPDGGPPTEFTDMRAAYDALSESMKHRISDLSAEHSYWYSRVSGGGPEPTEEELASRPPARHPLVHVRHGRKALYLASHASRIVGWPEDEGLALIRELMALATREEFTYAHYWNTGDILIWDNLATMHRARPFEDQTFVRDVRRTTCREARPDAVQAT